MEWILLVFVLTQATAGCLVVIVFGHSFYGYAGAAAIAVALLIYCFYWAAQKPKYKLPKKRRNEMKKAKNDDGNSGDNKEPSRQTLQQIIYHLSWWETALLYLPVVIIVVLFLFKLSILVGHLWLGFWDLSTRTILMGVLGPWVFLFYSYRRVPAADSAKERPPYKALPKFFGRRALKTLDEGWRLTLWPFFTLVLVNVKRRNVDVPVEAILTMRNPSEITNNDEMALDDPDQQSIKKQREKMKPGGSVGIKKVSYTWEPDSRDPAMLVALENIGGPEEAEKVFKDWIEQAARELGREHTWVSYSLGGQELLIKIIRVCTGKRITKEDIKEAGGSLEVGLANSGTADAAKIGGRFISFAVGAIKEEGGLSDAAEQVVIAEQDKEADEIKLKLLVNYTEQLVKLGLATNEAVEAVQLHAAEGDVTKVINAVRGFGGVGDAILAKFFGAVPPLDAGNVSRSDQSSRGGSGKEDEIIMRSADELINDPSAWNKKKE